jgi:hypothetical protein
MSDSTKLNGRRQGILARSYHTLRPIPDWSGAYIASSETVVLPNVGNDAERPAVASHNIFVHRNFANTFLSQCAILHLTAEVG